MAEIMIPLKAKYRVAPNKIRPALPGEPAGLVTLVYNGGRFKSKTSNAGSKSKQANKQGNGVRRKIYLGDVSR